RSRTKDNKPTGIHNRAHTVSVFGGSLFTLKSLTPAILVVALNSLLSESTNRLKRMVSVGFSKEKPTSTLRLLLVIITSRFSGFFDSTITSKILEFSVVSILIGDTTSDASIG